MTFIRNSIFAVAIAASTTAMAQGWAAKVQPAGSGASIKDAEDDGPPPPLKPFSGARVPLSPKAERGLAYSRQWEHNRNMPARGEDGSIVFTFGATLPTIVCAPQYVCDLVLQAGETVNNLNAGDTVRWQISPATQGVAESAITHVIIKPSDVGLVTNLVITTDRRAYTIKLVSSPDDWMPRVSFAYPDDTKAAWSAYQNAQYTAREQAAAAATGAGHAPKDFDFNYTLSGDSPSWRPTRVFSDGSKTYIEFPQDIAHTELPTLFALGDDDGPYIFTEPAKQIVNVRFVRGRFEVDKVLKRACLVSGVGGSEITVNINRGGSW